MKKPILPDPKFGNVKSNPTADEKCNILQHQLISLQRNVIGLTRIVDHLGKMQTKMSKWMFENGATQEDFADFCSNPESSTILTQAGPEPLFPRETNLDN